MIRLCSEDEALIILNEPATVKRLGFVSENMKIQPWVSYYGEYKLLFVFWLVENGVYEMHIACPKNSIIKSRLLAKEAIDFVFSVGAKKIITSCTHGKIANMAKKLGMNEYKRTKNKIYFEVIYGD